MPRRAERDALLSARRIGLLGVVRRHEPRDVREHRGVGQLASARIDRHLLSLSAVRERRPRARSAVGRSVVAARAVGDGHVPSICRTGAVVGDHPIRIVVLLLPALLACSREAPSTKTAPPDVGAPAPSARALSRFSVPLEYDVTAVLRLVEQVVPKTFGSMDSVRTVGGDSRKHYAFEATRGPFTAFATGREMHLRATLRLLARAATTSRRSGRRSARAAASAKQQPRIVRRAGDAADAHPRLAPALARAARDDPPGVHRRQRDRCDVGFLQYRRDRPRHRRRHVPRSSRKLPDIDRKVATVDLTGRVTEWWGCSPPIPLTEGVWLTLQPEQLRMGTVRGEAKVLTVPVSLDARPRIVTGQEPQPIGPPRCRRWGRTRSPTDSASRWTDSSTTPPRRGR